MSSFRAELTLDNQTFGLSRCYFEMHRFADDHGRPQSKPYWSTWINMESTDKTTIANWMMDPRKTLDVTITFYHTDQNSKFREIKLSKASCYLYHERFESDENYGLLRFQVMGDEVTINNSVNYKNA